jgi:hypothetical protein
MNYGKQVWQLLRARVGFRPSCEPRSRVRDRVSLDRDRPEPFTRFRPFQYMKNRYWRRNNILAQTAYLAQISPYPVAGWSSPVARKAHNLEVARSNRAPATKISHWHRIFFE